MLNESGEIVMALSSLSPMQRAAPRVNFDADRVRTLIAEYIGVDAKRVTDEARSRPRLAWSVKTRPKFREAT